jgi:alpha-L-fucosidase
MLIRCAGGDGNVLLNAGPTPTGEIAPEQANRLREMGAWLARNGESIYGTRGGPFKPGEYGVSTRRANTIYLHVCDWTEGVIKLPAIPRKVIASRVLSGGKAEVRQTAKGLEVSVPENDRQSLDTVVALELDGSALGLPAVDVPGPK